MTEKFIRVGKVLSSTFYQGASSMEEANVSGCDELPVTIVLGDAENNRTDGLSDQGN